MTSSSAFVASPSVPLVIGSCIRDAIQRTKSRTSTQLQAWEENDIAGRPLTEPILSSIRQTKFLVADISTLNFNVTSEIGYSIGSGRRVFLIKNRTLVSDDEKTRKIGIFDTLGFLRYTNDDDLCEILSSIEDVTPLPIPEGRDRKAPIYILETPHRAQSMNRIMARVGKARLQSRSFFASEEMRLSAVEAIHHVATSHGVIVPLLSEDAAGAEVHNIRAAFIAGLAHGLGRVTLILQDWDGPAPLDVRDVIKVYRHPNDIDDHIHAFSLDVYAALQEDDDVAAVDKGLLANLTIGDPMAENEFQELRKYYLQTNEYTRALRGEVNLVVGRKGSGKTALFHQVHEAKVASALNLAVGLKPEGYQLVKLKERVLDYLSEGAKAHLITAFWEYILYSEIRLALLHADRNRYMRDPKIFEVYRKLADSNHHALSAGEADFSERLAQLAENVSQTFKSRRGSLGQGNLSAAEITEMLYSHDLRELRNELSRYLTYKDEVWILFDNLDKGWSTGGLVAGDIIILRCLIDAARKIQREMRREGHSFFTMVFVRNDVYELLMQESPDFGKETRASLDWRDPDLLREMLRKRLTQNNFQKDTTFQQVWLRICGSHFSGEETSQYFVDRSLMRPRNLLKILSHCRGFAVNLQHQRIQEDDIEKGLRSYSDDLLTDADLELTAVEPEAADLLYHFIGEPGVMGSDRLTEIVGAAGFSGEKSDQIIRFLVYYGVLGIRSGGEDPMYIYHAGYDMRKMNIFMKKNVRGLEFVMNPALVPALT